MKKETFKTDRLWLAYLILITSIFTFSTCSDDKVDNLQSGWVRVLPLELDFSAGGGAKEVYLVLTGDIDSKAITYEVGSNGQDWCSLELTGNNLIVTVDPTYYMVPRTTIVTLKYGELKREIPVSQSASEGAEDTKLKVISATATTEETEQEQRGIECSYDGDLLTYFNSKFGAFTDWPFVIEYTLESASTLNYIMYHPRTDSGTRYGAFNEFDVLVSTEGNAAFTKVGSYTRGDANYAASMLTLETPVEKVKKIRFEIRSAHNNRISCAEMEFFMTSVNKFDYLKIFTDKTCSELKPGITETDIKKIPDADYKQLAIALLNNAYNAEYRVGEYRPYQNPSIMASTNKTSPYSLRDNPTGIYAETGEEMLVSVGDTHGQSLSMVVQDLSVGYGSSKTYPLLEGGNRVKITNGGLIYIQNLTNDPIPLILVSDAEKAVAAAKTVKVHFAFGKVNGYFDSQKNTAADWTNILRSAKYKDIDVLGKRAHITWKVQDFRDNNTDIVSVLEKYDRLVYLQQEFMGLEKYNKMFRNRMYFHIDYNGASPYASNNRTAYTPGYAEIFCKADRFEARLWGPAHEVGHCNQTRPGLKWAGTTEVTNNIHSMYIQQQFGQKSKLVADGTYATATAAIIDAQQPHCLNNASDEFVIKLVPFWQLKLYMIDALGKENFYRDLYEHYRVTANLNTAADTEGILQLDFVRQVCRISGLNMLDFFEKWGFLRPVNKTINDYGNKSFTITQAQINALVKEIQDKNYAKPHDNVYQITEDNINQYKN